MSEIDFDFGSLAGEINVEGDGKATASIRAVAKIVGVLHSTLGRHFQRGVLSGSKNAESLTVAEVEPGAFSTSKLAAILIDKGFDPATFARSGVPDLAISLIVEYYAFDAGARCTIQAKTVYRIFAAIGIRSWMHNLKGWKPSPFDKAFTLEMAVRREPMPWERMFSRQWIDLAEKTTGWSWDWRCMHRFIDNTCYDYLPSDVVALLKERNPVGDSGSRSHCLHQYLSEDVRTIVSEHLKIVEVLMGLADDNREFFETIMVKKFGRYRLNGGEDELPLFKTETVFISRPNRLISISESN